MTADIPELRRSELRRVVDLTDALLEVSTPAQLQPLLLEGVCRLVGGLAALWHEIELGPPVRELAVSWPSGFVSIERSRRVGPVLWTHPLIAPQRSWMSRGMKPPALGRMSEFATRRQWRSTPLRTEGLPEVDDQLYLVTRVHWPRVQFVSIDRQGGLFTAREQAVLGAAARHVRAAVARARSGPHPVLGTGPSPGWMLLDPRPRSQAGPSDRLTNRQREVLGLVAEGLTDAQVARRLGTTTRTVSKHLQRIYLTLGVSGRVAAVAVGCPR